MADFLIYARDSGSDPETQEQKGDIVEVRESGAPRGGLEAPPRFVWVECPDVDKPSRVHLADRWERIVDYSVVSRDVALDGWRLRVFNTTPSSGASTLGDLTRAQVETYLNNWGGVVQSIARNEVVFDWRILWGVSSQAFWRTNVSGVTFTELSYNTNTGVHRIQADHSFAQAAVIERVEERGGVIVSSTANRIRFDIDRSVVLSAFQEDVKRSLNKAIRRRRACIPESTVNTLLAGSGVMQVTAGELGAMVTDRREE